ncbi:MAG TPA: Na+/H+ antiporter subunit E [Nannocystaceae bacterium]|nr:Na+/H+ antiporter subunit E [Nannocystaceae bacterium]
MRAARRLAPTPLMSAALLGVWLALVRSTSLDQIALGLVIAVAVQLATANLRASSSRVRRPLVVVRFVATVGYDVLASNFAVAWGVIAWRWRQPRARFVRIPLELRDPVGLAALAMVTTIVPGTVWSELALDRSTLLLHVWNVEGREEDFVARFKARYEAPLREIFE